MKALHVRTYGMFCDRCTTAVEDAVSRLDGVTAAMAVKSLDLTSVLYEPLAVSPESIAKAIRSLGFETRIIDDNGDRVTPVGPPAVA